MSNYNPQRHRIDCKIVYYGPKKSGKIQNLEMVYQNIPKKSRSELLSVATQDGNSSFLYMTMKLGIVSDVITHLKLFTIPNDHDAATCKIILQQVDGIVFVADSREIEANLESLAMLEEYLKAVGADIKQTPIVMQWNRRDAEDALSLEELEAKVNYLKAKSFPSIALTGEGVFPTLKECAILTLKSIKERLNSVYPYLFSTPIESLDVISNQQTQKFEKLKEKETAKKDHKKLTLAEYQKWSNVCEQLIGHLAISEEQGLNSLLSSKSKASFSGRTVDRICSQQNLDSDEFYELTQRLVKSYDYIRRRAQLELEVIKLEQEKKRFMALLQEHEWKIKNEINVMEKKAQENEHLNHNNSLVKENLSHIKGIWEKLGR